MKPALEALTPLLQVFDMPASIVFYRDVLGFEIAETAPARGPDDFDWALLRLDGSGLMLNTAHEVDERPPAPDPARVAAHRDTALFFGCRDLDSAYAYLCAQGIDLEKPKVAPYGMKQLWLRDPDGYVICLQWPAG
jgi:glyoxylase I family protein